MQNFIVIALVVLCTGVALGDESNVMQKIVEDCNQENGVNMQEMHDFVSGKLSGAAVKDNLKCSILCVMTKKGFMNEAGKFDLDTVRSHLKEEDSKIIEPALEQCKNVSGSTPCETAFMISQCLLENNVPMH